jgi:hypothetical protein
MKMNYKKGDLVRFRYGGRLATVMCDVYSARFIDATDREMIAHGMGHFAGTYGGAVDVCYTDTLQVRKKVKLGWLELVSASEA